MQVSVYKLSSNRLKGSLYLGYKNGLLTNFESELLEPLTDEQWDYLRQRLPLQEEQVQGLTAANLKVIAINAKSIKDKVILFCQYYKAYRNVSYVAKILEKANLKGIPVTESLLKTFFESPLQNFTLKNYIDRINITKDLLKNGGSARFPAYYDRDFERTLSPELTQEYHKHLVNLGWSKEYSGAVGTVWKEKSKQSNR